MLATDSSIIFSRHKHWLLLPSFRAADRGEQSLPGNMVAMAADTLRWLFFLETWRPEVVRDISPTTKYTRLMCTFLAGMSFLSQNKTIY